MLFSGSIPPEGGMNLIRGRGLHDCSRNFAVFFRSPRLHCARGPLPEVAATENESPAGAGLLIIRRALASEGKRDHRGPLVRGNSAQPSSAPRLAAQIAQP